jgi:ubiquinone/menaquinone biosynthesis C-methylase UbiE
MDPKHQMVRISMQFEAWDKVAPDVNFNLEIDMEKLLSFVPFDAKVLDFGCGYGRNCSTLATAGFSDVIGVDSSLEMINRGNRDNPKLHLIHNATNKLSYPDGYFDLILICAVLTCIPDDAQCKRIMAELKRVLKPNGMIHLVEFCSEAGQSIDSNIGVAMKHRTPKALSDLANTFKLVSAEVVNTATLSGGKASSFSYFGVKGA